MRAPAAIDLGFRVLLCGAALVLSGCPSKPPAIPPLTTGLTVDDASVSLYSFADSEAYRFSLADGSVLTDQRTKPALRGAWARGDVVYGWDAAGDATAGLLAMEARTKIRRWNAAPVTRTTIHWVDDHYIYAGRSLVDVDSGALLIAYRWVLQSGSPDLVIACDDSDRAFAVKPANGSVYWQQGTCGDAVAVHGRRWSRVAKQKLDLCEVSTGAPVWRVPMESATLGGDRPGMGFDLVAMDETRVYVAGERGVSAHSIDDGTNLWTAPQRGDLIARDGVVVVLAGFALDVLDAATGKIRFHAAAEGDPRASLRVAFAPGKLLLRTNVKLTAFDLATGAVLWSKGVGG